MRDVALGPNQRAQMGGDRSLGARPDAKAATKRSFVGTLALVGLAFALVVGILVVFWQVPPAEVPQLFLDVCTFKRVPMAAQDNAAAMASIVVFLVPLVLVDQLVCMRM